MKPWSNYLMDTNSKQLGFLIPILIITIVVAWITFWPPQETTSAIESGKSNTQKTATVSIDDGTVVSVRVADTELLRQKGLSGVKSLEKNTGMLFVFEKPGKHSFWMKDMFMPIDIIWISEDNTIVHIEKNISPDTYPQLFAPSKNALYVLEVEAGFSETHDLYIADQVTFL